MFDIIGRRARGPHGDDCCKIGGDLVKLGNLEPPAQAADPVGVRERAIAEGVSLCQLRRFRGRPPGF